MTAQTFTQWGAENFPAMHRTGRPGIFTGICISLIADVIAQVSEEAILTSLQNEPTSPDDALGSIGDQCSLPRYAGESLDNHLARINAKWDTWRGAGNEATIVSQLTLAGFATARIYSDIPAGGDPSNDIPNYPATADYWSQFIVELRLDAALGSGTESALVSDPQLDTIRLIIRKFKPADWICREIVIVQTDADIHYDDPDLFYDDPSLLWLDDTAVELVERHPPLRVS